MMVTQTQFVIGLRVLCGLLCTSSFSSWAPVGQRRRSRRSLEVCRDRCRFGRRADRGSGAHGRIPFCCVVSRWIGSGRDRGHFRLQELLGIEFVAHVKRVSAKAEIKRIKVTRAGKKRQEWFEEADLAHAVDEASRGRKPRKAVEEETAMRAHTRRNQRNFAVGAEREKRRRPEKRWRNP